MADLDQKRLIALTRLVSNHEERAKHACKFKTLHPEIAQHVGNHLAQALNDRLPEATRAAHRKCAEVYAEALLHLTRLRDSGEAVLIETHNRVFESLGGDLRVSGHDSAMIGFRLDSSEGPELLEGLAKLNEADFHVTPEHMAYQMLAAELDRAVSDG